MHSLKSVTLISTSSLSSPVDMKAEWAPYVLDFRFLARTSRNSMREKETYFMRLTDESTGRQGVGECALFKGLSAEDSPNYELELSEACHNLDKNSMNSSIRFGYEGAVMDMMPLEDNEFTRGEAGIPINGLIWMGDRHTMRQRIDEKLSAGFHVLKLKIGGINFEEEVDLLRYIRNRFPADALELRLDANGSFDTQNAMARLDALAKFDIHSIEQPIKPGQWDAMSQICSDSPIPIALDEELIGLRSENEVKIVLDTLHPAYIILKPSLCGGFQSADCWIGEAEKRGIGWWATSALESNVGLEAIARWLVMRSGSASFKLPQGLGTGQLYHNNIESPLELRGDKLFYNPDKKRVIPELKWQL